MLLFFFTFIQEIEYDMDEEDVAWLKIMNDKRKGNLIIN